MRAHSVPGSEDRLADREEASGAALVRRLYLPRLFGTLLGTLCLGAALDQHGTAAWVWALLGFQALAWPHLAFRWALASADPRAGEHRNLFVDAASCGFWILAIGVNPLPGVLLPTMLASSLLAVGGPRLLLRAVPAVALGAVLGLLAFGLRLEPLPGRTVVLASMPVLVAFPILIGLGTHQLSRELKRQKEVLRSLHEHDALSGLHSRAWLDGRLVQEFERFGRYGRPVALLLMDVDHFKSINDSRGHLAGDEVIRQFGKLLEASLRAGDMVGRYGGEEFAALLPETEAEEAFGVAERIRSAVAAHDFAVGGGFLRITVSVGAATLPPAASSCLAWVERADRALYRAKREGRDRVRLDAPQAGSERPPV